MWCVRLSDSQRDALRELVEGQDQDSVSDSLRAAYEALELARWDDLPDASLPWDRVAELARAQEIGEADEVQQRQRPHRVAGAQLHAGVHGVGLEAARLEKANGVE